MKHGILFVVLLTLGFALSGAVRFPPTKANKLAAIQQETDDELKVSLYKKFTDNRVPNPALAYEAAKEYLRRYAKDKDQYTDYLTKWTAAYEEDERARRLAAEREERERRLLHSVYGDNLLAAWKPARAVAQNERCLPRALNGYQYRSTNAGTTGNAEPVWPARIGATVLDGSVTWQAIDKFKEAYDLAKQVLADDPGNLKVIIALGYGGYLAATEAKNEKFNLDSLGYAQTAIRMIEAGKALDSWEPFKSRDDTLASLHYATGFLKLKAQPEEAIVQFTKVAQIDSDLKKTPSTYYLLAAAYEKGPYQKLSADYTRRFANQPETSESKTALQNLNRVIDRIVDAYARAVALAGNDPKHQASKAEWSKRLTELYRFEHGNSDAGLSELIAGVLSKPLPQP